MSDREFDDAWCAFARQDAQTRAPVRIAGAVMQAWDAASRKPSRARARLWPFAIAAGVAAAALVTVVALRDTVRPRPSAPLATAARTIAPVAILSADAPFDTEPLQIVRIRIPGSALPALGVSIVEPEAAGLVDVDLLVGEDGLPREIRRVRAARASALQE
ncbi:MAG TPA: hypothetical protein VI485_03800 [Vicinamibacterales bacterium]|nr:hypothetical protein [Vicinamibacterales bacterium]